MRKVLVISFCALFVLLSGCGKTDNADYVQFDGTMDFLHGGESSEGGGGGEEDVPVEPEVIADNQLKVISFNVKTDKGDEGSANSWALRKEAVMKMFEIENPTIFGLQESRLGQVNDIRSALPAYSSAGVSRDDGTETGKGEYGMIFWKTSEMSLVNWGTFWLSPTPEIPSMGWDEAESYKRCATWAVFTHKKTGKGLFFVNTHLGLVAENRKNGASLIASRIRSLNTSSFPVVLVGDFNAIWPTTDLEPLDALLENLREKAPQTDRVGTYNAFSGKKTIIDYIYYSGLKPLKYHTINNSWLDVRYISDHYPISGILEFPD